MMIYFHRIRILLNSACVRVRVILLYYCKRLDATIINLAETLRVCYYSFQQKKKSKLN